MNNKKSLHTVYAVSITDFTMKKHDKGEFKLLDRAVVLHKSIKLEMEKSITYDYHLYAFVHPGAVEYVPIMTSLGYCIQVRDTPFNISDIKIHIFYPIILSLFILILIQSYYSQWMIFLI